MANRLSVAAYGMDVGAFYFCPVDQFICGERKMLAGQSVELPEFVRVSMIPDGL
jgi:hypothetical protein